MKKRSSFTMIELFICLTILGLLSGVMLFFSHNVVGHYRFHHAAQELTSHLMVTKRLAQSYQTDISFRVLQQEGKLSCYRFTDEPLPTEQHLLHKNFFIGNVDAFFVNDQKLDQTTFFFSGNGWMSPMGVLTLGNKNKTVSFDLCHCTELKKEKPYDE